MEEFIRSRVSQLRLQKGISAREMSLSLGQNEAYINQIENGRMLPSLQGLFYICDYLGITLHQFFDEESIAPSQVNEITKDLKRLDTEALTHVAAVVKAFLPRT